jgi:PEP-CTERM motif-containing protein
MLRKFVSGLSLVAIVATGAAAQVPFQETFRYQQDLLNQPTTHTGVFNPGDPIATGELLSGGPGSASVAFQVWCVDPMNFVFQGGGPTEANAWITPLIDADFSHTLDRVTQSNSSGSHTATTNADAKTDYLEAAWLAANMTSGNQWIYQDAIWQVMGYTGFGLHSGVTQAQIDAATGLYDPSDPNFHADEWAVISNNVVTGKDCFVGGGGEAASAYCQEFIYHREVGSFLSNTPEPATMSLMAMGLVGMAGTSIRRRKQRKA